MFTILSTKETKINKIYIELGMISHDVKLEIER